MTARVLVVSAPSSGSGKTTLATGLMAALRRRGTVVAPFKVGPDYIDPGYHALATGRPGRNLDPVLVGEQRILPLARHGAAGAEIAVVEGVMGLFDGRLRDGAGSTAQVAGLLGAPVVLVVDCRGQSRSLAALLHGFRSFDPAVRVAGVVLNRVGSPRHEDVLRVAADEVGLPVLGALPRRDALAVPSRHLGLVTAAEHGAAAHAAVDAMAELVAAHVDLDAVVALATPLPDGPAWDPGVEVGGADTGAGDRTGRTDPAPGCVAPAPLTGPERGTHRAGSADPPRRLDRPTRRSGSAGSPVSTGRLAGADRTARGAGEPRVVVGVFGGAAFTFGYAEHVELLAAAGAEVVVVDPLRDEVLPGGTGGLVLPGGFPEEHAAALGANVPLRTAVRALAASGAPVHAECAGLLYLCESLDGAPMCGVLPARAVMTDRLTLGYRDAVALGDSTLFTGGERVSGHEFHRCAVEPRAGADAAWGWRGAEPEGWLDGGVHASFVHTHPAGHPYAVRRFVGHCHAPAAPC